jgi:predicted MFS family arabinose efflux permease
LFALGGLIFSRASGPLLRHFAQPALARLGGALLTTGFTLLAILPNWTWAAVGCAVAGFGFYAFHSNLQVSATQLSTHSRGVAVSLFACSLWVGQSLGVAAAAITFTRLPPAASFGAAAAALALLCHVFANQLSGRQSSHQAGSSTDASQGEEC